MYSLGKLDAWAVLPCMHKDRAHFVGFRNYGHRAVQISLRMNDRNAIYSLMGGMKAISSSSERCCGGRLCRTDWLK